MAGSPTLPLILSSLLLVSCSSTVFCYGSGKAPAKGLARIVPDRDLVYVGAFKVPNTGQVNSYWGYTHGFIAFNPNGNQGKGSIIGTGHGPRGYVSEISIPDVNVDTLGNLPRAQTLQHFTEIRGGLEDDQTKDVRQTTYGLTVVPRQGSQSSDKLYWVSIYDYMPSSDTSGFTVGYSNLDFSKLNAQGKWNLKGYAQHKGAEYSWYALTLPQEWADGAKLEGKYLGLGRARQNASGGQGYGPSLYAVSVSGKDAGPVNGTSLDCTKLLGYPNTAPMDRNYSHSDGVQGGTWLAVGGKSALVFTYSKGMRSAKGSHGDYPFEDYKYPSCMNDGFCWPESSVYNSSDSDYKSGPWISSLLFFDAADIAAVAAGDKKPEEVKPYATYQIERYLKRPKGVTGDAPMSTNKVLGGIAFDSKKRRVYVEELLVDAGLPIIHVFELHDNGKELSLAPPGKPAKVSNTGATVYWTASVDSSGDSSGITYVVFKWFPLFVSPAKGKCESGVTGAEGNCVYPAMWRPIAATTALTWRDPAHRPGDRYNVTAYDKLMHPSHVLNRP